MCTTRKSVKVVVIVLMSVRPSCRRASIVKLFFVHQIGLWFLFFEFFTRWWKSCASIVAWSPSTWPDLLSLGRPSVRLLYLCLLFSFLYFDSCRLVHLTLSDQFSTSIFLFRRRLRSNPTTASNIWWNVSKSFVAHFSISCNLAVKSRRWYPSGQMFCELWNFRICPIFQ